MVITEPHVHVNTFHKVCCSDHFDRLQKCNGKKGKITFEKSKLYYTTQELLCTVRHFTSANYCSCVLLPASRRNLRVPIGEFLHINHLLHHFLRGVFSTSDALDRFLNNRR